MNTKQTQALELRKQGKTYTEISSELGVALSTLSFWLKNNAQSFEVKKENLKKSRPLVAKKLIEFNTLQKNKLHLLYKQAEEEAEEEFAHFINEPLFISGISIYLGQGSRNPLNNQITVSSRNAATLHIFMRFCRHYLRITDEKLRFWPLLYENSKVSEVCEWWQNELKLTIEQFYKPQVMKGKEGKETLLYGVGNIIIGSKLHKIKLERWSKLVSAVLGE